jgi:hypothetical protein
VEHFDLSLLLLGRKLDWTQPPYYLRENIGKSKPGKRSKIDPQAVQIIQDRNQLDIELYNYALQRFNQEVEKEGDALIEELAAFQIANQKYSNIKQPQRKLKDNLSVLKSKLLKKDG